MKKISVIIPAYNEEKYVEKTFLSIKNQSFRDYQIILVANGCTDKTIEVAKKYADRIFNINISNASFARNIGAQHAAGDILVFLDADTRLAENALEEMSSQFNNDTAVATMHAHPNESKFFFRIINSAKNFLHSYGLYAGSSGVIITSKELFHAVGGFNVSKHIAETSSFIKKLKEFGEYSVISNTNAVTSTRRYEQWGVMRTAFFWIVNRWIFGRDVKYEAVR